MRAENYFPQQIYQRPDESPNQQTGNSVLMWEGSNKGEWGHSCPVKAILAAVIPKRVFECDALSLVP